MLSALKQQPQESKAIISAHFKIALVQAVFEFTIPNSKAKVQNVHTLSCMVELSEYSLEDTENYLYGSYNLINRDKQRPGTGMKASRL